MSDNGKEPQQDSVRVRTAAASGQDRDTLSLSIEGRLNIHTLSTASPQTLDPIHRERPKSVVIDGAGLIYCDGAGLGLIAEVRRTLITFMRINIRPSAGHLVGDDDTKVSSRPTEGTAIKTRAGEINT
jgi:hypothetical protein